MNLYLYTKAPTLANAVATSLADLNSLVAASANPLNVDNATEMARIQATIPELALGDSTPLTVYAYDDANTLSSWSGAASNTIVVGLGLLDLNGDQLLASGTLTPSGSAFTGRLDLTPAVLVSRVQAVVSGGYQRGKYWQGRMSGAPFPIHFRRVDGSGNKETYALFNIMVRDRVLSP